MSLLLDVDMPELISDTVLRDRLEPLLPGVDIVCAGERYDPSAITMLALVAARPGQFDGLVNLRLVQKLGAGVDGIADHPGLPPTVRVARLKPDAPAREIAEYCLAYVLADLRDVLAFHGSQAARDWRPKPPRSSRGTTVGVLGLGHIGARVAAIFAATGFEVLGWSRSPHRQEGVTCLDGADTLDGLLGWCDFVVCVLPSTRDTRNLFNSQRFAAMKPGTVLINVGRGDLVVERDLVEALDGGRPGGAVLDVFRDEPLPATHPFWTHPKVVVTPHVSGWHLGDGVADVAENYRRLMDGRPLLHEVDRDAGY